MVKSIGWSYMCICTVTCLYISIYIYIFIILYVYLIIRYILLLEIPRVDFRTVQPNLPERGESWGVAGGVGGGSKYFLSEKLSGSSHYLPKKSLRVEL